MNFLYKTVSACAGVSLCLVAGTSAANERPGKPNIVHIMVDDLGWQDIASHKIDGKPMYETPHLDRMTKMGRRFTQAYAPAPCCAPSRVAFLRGQHPVNTGVYHVTGGRIPRPWKKGSNRISPYYSYGLPPEEPMIPMVLKRAGYISGHVAKWHAGGKQEGYPFPLDQGFDFGFSEKDGFGRYYNDPELWNPKDGNRNQFWGSMARMAPDRLSDFATQDPEDPFQLDAEGRPFDKLQELALGFIRKHKDKPFFLNYCPIFVHTPIQTRDRRRFEYYLDKMGHPFPTDPGPVYHELDGHMNPYYASMVDTVDWMIGQIITYLEETDDPRNPGHKLIDNTYVIVDSDNGGVLPYTDNAPLRGRKQNTWEGGIRIPFIVRGPGVPAGSSCDVPINLIDLFPTFMTMAGVAPDESLKLDGYDLLPLIEGKADAVIQQDGTARESLFWHYPWDAHMSSALRRGDFKLVRNYGARMGGNAGENVQLFRLYNADGSAGDISEAVEVGDQFPEVRASMLAELDHLIAETGAPLPFRNPLGDGVPERDAATVPAVLELGSKEDRVWVTVEAGTGKAAIVDAQLLYTLNPAPFDSNRGRREEWFAAPAEIRRGRVEATMPPGATHAAFCMRDANGFLITSDPMPSVREVKQGADSPLLKNGYAYRPGLFALIKLGEGVESKSPDLVDALTAARAQVTADPIQEKPICDAIRSLRGAIRNQKDAPAGTHPALNRFPTEPLF